MVDRFLTVRAGRGPLIATAIHAGHDVRPEVEAALAIDAASRRYEEDPFTDRWVGLGDSSVVVHRSRFEVDLNRPRDRTVYPGPEDAWGLHVFGGPPPPEIVAGSRELHDRFYARMERLCERARSAFGAFIVYDLHTYNHRRRGPDARPGDPRDNPDINVGTGSVHRDRWGPLVERFIEVAGAQEVAGRPLDVRENVRFTGGYLADWVHERFPDSGVCLSIDVKKVFMDEHSGALDATVLVEIGRALAATVAPVVSVLRRASTRV